MSANAGPVATAPASDFISKMAQANQQLNDDHVSLDELLQQLQLALADGDLESTRATLDLFWARLAVHIRAEHLHFFPAVLNALRREDVAAAAAPTLSEAERLIATLKDDHDFFMSELAVAMKIVRGLPPTGQAKAKDGLRQITDKVKLIVQRLQTHNVMEEDQIYNWAAVVFTAAEQAELAPRISAELNNRPPRFGSEDWLKSTE
jgi:hypothetical protein